MRPLDLKSNALTTRPSWCRYLAGSQPFLHSWPGSQPPPGPPATLEGAPSRPPTAAAPSRPPLFPARRAPSARGGARGRPLPAAEGGRARPGGERCRGPGPRPSRADRPAAASFPPPGAGPLAEGGGGGGARRWHGPAPGAEQGGRRWALSGGVRGLRAVRVGAERAHPPRSGQAVVPVGSSGMRGIGEVVPIRHRHFIISVQVFPAMYLLSLVEREPKPTKSKTIDYA
ncbi:translation initiation factor IF-2-like [Serinus canaria]|uniref:translation initiation factor IF-2-like n=1 Tax=Serinus canaria TaxID=9135 RepID=UPI0021CCE217|nr:translation initiation factor IF-2-like [Serinus canaria]XP_050828976.1 translation initiation factor IF-2-like [Serinus canaria]